MSTSSLPPSSESPFRIRAAEAAELDDALATSYAAFGERPAVEALEDERTLAEIDRLLVAVDERDGGAIVGTGMAYSFEVTVPGGNQLPAAGISWVGVLPTHRRRGIIRSLIDRQLDDVAARGEPLAILLASEAPIYGRFGYGAATRYIKVELDPARSAFHRPPATSPSARIRLIGTDEAGTILPPIFDRYRRSRTGEVGRSDAYWSVLFRDAEYRRGGASNWFFAVHDDGGQIDGYAAYRVKDTWTDDHPKNTMSTSEVIATDPEVEAALWRFLLDMDLIAKVHTRSRPADDALKWRFVDERCYRTVHVGDWLWLRLVDPVAALSARRYRVEGSLVFELHDRFRPFNDGVYRLDGASDGAECRKLEPGSFDDVGVDLELAVDALGSLYLGGVPASTLANGGRIRERRPGALARADLLLGTHPEPICSMPF